MYIIKIPSRKVLTHKMEIYSRNQTQFLNLPQTIKCKFPTHAINSSLYMFISLNLPQNTNFVYFTLNYGKHTFLFWVIPERFRFLPQNKFFVDLMTSPIAHKNTPRRFKIHAGT